MNAIQVKRLTECLTLLLGDLSGDEFNWIATQLEWLSFKSGDYLFKQGLNRY